MFGERPSHSAWLAEGDRDAALLAGWGRRLPPAPHHRGAAEGAPVAAGALPEPAAEAALVEAVPARQLCRAPRAVVLHADRARRAARAPHGGAQLQPRRGALAPADPRQDVDLCFLLNRYVFRSIFNLAFATLSSQNLCRNLVLKETCRRRATRPGR